MTDRYRVLDLRALVVPERVVEADCPEAAVLSVLGIEATQRGVELVAMVCPETDPAQWIRMYRPAARAAAGDSAGKLT